MTRRAVLLVCCVLVSAGPLGAQRGSSKADPVSGTWTGHLDIPMSRDPVAVTLELKFDGKGKVSGTFTGLQNPGDVKAGTFNQETGALKLELGKTGESDVLITLEGSVTKGIATGKVTGEGGNGEFKIEKKSR